MYILPYHLLFLFFEHNNHKGKYDYIIEQIFLCALQPRMRQKYVWKMTQLLSDYLKLVGLLFNCEFEISSPFGGSIKEYEQLFHKAFVFNFISLAENSIASRANTELFFEFQKNHQNLVNLYHFEGIICSGCMNTVSNKFLEIESVLNGSRNTDFS